MLKKVSLLIITGDTLTRIASADRQNFLFFFGLRVEFLKFFKLIFQQFRNKIPAQQISGLSDVTF